MAASVADSRLGHFRKWLGLLAPSDQRWEFAARIAVICALTTLIMEIYEAPFGSLAAILGLCMSRPDRTTSLIACVVFTIVGTLIVGILLLVAPLVINDSMWRVIAMAVISVTLLFVLAASKLRPLGTMIAVSIGYGLDLLGSMQGGEETTRAFLYVWLAVAIAAGVSFVVNLALGPAPRRLAEKAIAHRLRLSAAVLRQPMDSLVHSFRECLHTGVGAVLANLKMARFERSISATDLAALHQSALSCMTVMSAIDVLQSSPEATLPQSIRGDVADTLDQMAAAFERGAYPVNAELTSWPHSDELTSLASSALAEIQETVRRFADASAKLPAPPKEKTAFFQKDAWTNPEYVHFALRTTAAGMFCYFLISVLNWPQIHTCFFTVYLVSQTTAAESIRKLTLRITGCLVGAGLGLGAIVFLVPSWTSIGGLLAIVVTGSLAAGYLIAGGPRIGYAGIQLGVAFFLQVIQGIDPSFNLTPGRDRIIGVLIGNVVAYLAIAHWWPVSISRRIDAAITSAWKHLAAMMSGPDTAGRSLLASRARSALTEAAADIELCRLEARSIRPDEGWLSTRERATQESQALSTLLLLGANQRELSPADVEARLESLGSRLRGQNEAPAASHPPEDVASPLQGLIDKSLVTLEQLLTGRHADRERTAHATA